VATIAQEITGTKAEVNEVQLFTELQPLAEKWRSYSDDGLELRHETGKLLNRHLGEPKKRQLRGEGVLEKVEERLRIDVSEISRLRWFAQHFSSVNDLNDRYPDATTWTVVKALLPTLRPKKQLKARTSAARKLSTARLEALSRSAQTLTGKLRDALNALTEAQKQQVRATFQDLAQAVTDCLTVRVTVDEDKVPAAEATPTPEAPSPQGAPHLRILK